MFSGFNFMEIFTAACFPGSYNSVLTITNPCKLVEKSPLNRMKSRNLLSIVTTTFMSHQVFCKLGNFPQTNSEFASEKWWRRETLAFPFGDLVYFQGGAVCLRSWESKGTPL